MTVEDSNRSPAGDRQALDGLFDIAYNELRRLASSVRRSDGSATLTPTTLVHEAWLKLAKTPVVGAISTLHFKRIAARAMRQVLVEAARRRDAGKRGAAMTVAFDDTFDPQPATGREVLALDAALRDLAAMNPRQAGMIEMRFFAGLDVAEVSAVFNISEATVMRDWRAAKAWLAHELRNVR